MLHSVSFRNIYYGTLWQMEKDVYHSIVCNSKRPKTTEVSVRRGLVK